MGGKIVKISFAAVLAALSGTLCAGPAGQIRIFDLVQRAEAIFAGKPDQAIASANGAVLNLRVTRVLKGGILPGDQLVAFWESARATGTPSITSSATGLWFLQKVDGQWQVLPLMKGDIPFSATYLPVPAEPPGGAFLYGPATDPFDKVLREAGAALESSTSNAWLDLLFATGALDPPEFDQGRWLYAHLAELPQARLRALGLQGLVRGGDIAALIRLSNSSDVLQEVNKKPLLAGSVCDFRNTDPGAIRVLGDIAKSSGPAPLKTCAAYALRAAHTRDSLPVLAELLDSDSPELRYEGIAGLAAFANGLPTLLPTMIPSMAHMAIGNRRPYATEETRSHFPTKAAFQQDETKYVSFWKTWWVTHRAELGF